MPLAIELAASRYATLGLDGLEEGLHERLRFFTVGSSAAGRHRSLHDTIGWSYDLLRPAEQALLRGVAMFASWFDVDAAHTVAAPASGRAAVADVLARLADHSLLIVDRGEPTRYRALETIRQYAEELLDEAGELPAVQARHEAWCRAVLTELAAATRRRLVHPVRPRRRRRPGRAGAVRSRSRPQRWRAELAAQLAGQLWLRGRLTEAQRRYEQAAELDRRRRTGAASADGRRRGGYGCFGNDCCACSANHPTGPVAGDRGGAAYDLAWMSLYITGLRESWPQTLRSKTRLTSATRPGRSRTARPWPRPRSPWRRRSPTSRPARRAVGTRRQRRPGCRRPRVGRAPRSNS